MLSRRVQCTRAVAAGRVPISDQSRAARFAVKGILHIAVGWTLGAMSLVCRIVYDNYLFLSTALTPERKD